MGKIDEVKEILNTLRVALSLAFGVFVLIVGRIIGFYEAQKFDEIFWLSIMSAVANLIAIVLIVRKISSKTREIKDL